MAPRVLQSEVVPFVDVEIVRQLPAKTAGVLSVTLRPATHYIPAFANTFDGRQQAICGALIDPHVGHRDLPSCASCQQLLADEPIDDSPIDEDFGANCGPGCGFCGACS